MNMTSFPKSKFQFSPNRPFRNSTGNWGEFQILTNRLTDTMKDHIEIDHLTKYDTFRVNRNQVMDLEIWLKIHTNASNFETASPKTI